MPLPLNTIRISDPVPYKAMFERQVARRDAIASGDETSTLFLLEHTPVFTLGRDAHPEHLLKSTETLAKMGIEVVSTDRGGDVTYHGPGQIVAYPLLDLKRWKLSVTGYLRTLEDVLIKVLERYGLQGERIEGLTGVWVDGAKIAAIGIGVRRWVTFHGVALNVNPNMDHFKLIVPCGIPDKPVTSLAQCLQQAPAMVEVMKHFDDVFNNTFDVKNR